MALPYPKPHPPFPAPADTAVHELAHASADDLQLHFHKGLEHDGSGRVAPAAFESLRTALDLHEPHLFKAIQLAPGGTRKLVNPQAGLAADRETADGWWFKIPKPPERSHQKATTAAEMIELYWMALLRDLPFEQFSTDPDAAAAAAELSALNSVSRSGNGEQSAVRGARRHARRAVSRRRLDAGGPTQAGAQGAVRLPVPAPAGSLWYPRLRPARTAQGGDRLSVRRSLHDRLSGLAGQAERKGCNGTGHRYRCRNLYSQHGGLGALRPYRSALRGVSECRTHSARGWLLTGRGKSLCPEQRVRQRARLRLLRRTAYPLDGLRGGHTRAEGGLVSEMGASSAPASGGIWRAVHRALAMDAPGKHAAETALGAGLAVLQASETSGGAVDRIHQRNNTQGHDTYLLPMAFAEGSPTHPAYGAGHATVAGACVTVLKACFDESKRLVDISLMPQVPDPAQGYTALKDYAGADLDDLTVRGELDKVAANIAIGRNMAGVHWRSDYSQSALLGQRIAISMLYHQRRDYHERPWSFSFTSFGHNTIEIVLRSTGPAGRRLLQRRRNSRSERRPRRTARGACVAPDRLIGRSAGTKGRH